MSTKTLERVLIEQVVTTPFEKVVRILNKIKTYLIAEKEAEAIPFSNEKDELVNELEWAISKIETHTLYSYDINDDIDIIKQCKKSNSKVKHLVDYITGYSELSRSNYQRSGMFSKVRDEVEVKRDGSHKNTLRPNTAKIKKVQELRNQKFVYDLLNCRSHSLGSENESTSSTDSDGPSKKHETKEKNASTKTIEPPAPTEEIKPSQPPKKPVKTIKKFHRANTIVSSREKINLDFYSKSFPLIEISSLSFNFMSFKRKVGKENVLPIIGKYLFKAFDLGGLIEERKLDTFLCEINKGYFFTTKYHNSMHAADVTQTLASFFLNSNIPQMLALEKKDILYSICAALGHDLGHPGTNNNFQINALSEIALIYNNNSVLENFHTSNFFKLIKEDKNNIFSNLSNAEFQLLRKRVINLILSTDMFYHIKVFGIIKTKTEQLKSNESLSLKKNSPSIFEEQQDYLNYFLHSADLGHNTKKFEITEEWVDLLNEEFLLQGDKEKELNLPISYLCDRTKVDLPKSQIGFINAFIIPSFEVLAKISPSLKVYLDNAKENLGIWERKNDQSNCEKKNNLP